MPITSINVDRCDHPGEKVFVMGSREPVHIEPDRIEWTVHIELDNGDRGPTMDMTIHDPEMFFWSKRAEYVADQEMYVIQEMTP